MTFQVVGSDLDVGAGLGGVTEWLGLLACRLVGDFLAGRGGGRGDFPAGRWRYLAGSGKRRAAPRNFSTGRGAAASIKISEEQLPVLRFQKF